MKFYLSNQLSNSLPVPPLRHPHHRQTPAPLVLAAVVACDEWLGFWNETAVRQSALALLHHQWPDIIIAPKAPIELLVGQNGRDPQTHQKLKQLLTLYLDKCGYTPAAVHIQSAEITLANPQMHVWCYVALAQEGSQLSRSA